jgi:hypothetical protein
MINKLQKKASLSVDLLGWARSAAVVQIDHAVGGVASTADVAYWIPRPCPSKPQIIRRI